MKTTNVNGIELAYDVQGEGEPVLFIQGAIWADFLRPLAEQPPFSGFQRIRYPGRGYGESGGPGGGFDMQAADIAALLDHLEVDRAHLVGHSEGAMIALVLAASYPDRVRSLAVLEPLPSSSWMAASEFADLLVEGELVPFQVLGEVLLRLGAERVPVDVLDDGDLAGFLPPVEDLLLGLLQALPSGVPG